MPKEFPRSRRVSEQIHRVLSELIRTEIKDPRLRTVSLTEVKVSKDLGHAWVYFTLLDPGEDAAPAVPALQGAAGFLRGQLGRILNIRHTPELHFIRDDTGERGARMDALISEAVKSDRAKAHDSDG